MASRYMPQQRVFIIEHYFHSTFYAHMKSAFKRKFSRTSELNDSIINRLVDKFRNEYTVADILRSGRARALSHLEHVELCERMEEEPGTLARRFN